MSHPNHRNTGKIPLSLYNAFHISLEFESILVYLKNNEFDYKVMEYTCIISCFKMVKQLYRTLLWHIHTIPLTSLLVYNVLLFNEPYMCMMYIILLMPLRNLLGPL